MAKFNQLLSHVLTWIATVLLGGFVLTILLGVFYRYVLNAPLVWSEELARNLNIWSVFLGATVALYEIDHLRVDILDRSVERWPHALRALLSLLLIAAEALFAWSLVLGGWHMTLDRWDVPLTTLPINQGWIYLAAPLSAVIMLWFLAWQAWGTARSFAHRGGKR